MTGATSLSDVMVEGALGVMATEKGTFLIAVGQECVELDMEAMTDWLRDLNQLHTRQRREAHGVRIA